ncbi:hypothetical protein [Methanomethylophilus alvi]|uniref:hypothetical protein n=1 Tax=Methanomethylophilus alvi TaxID=1291540 RepID=UPI0037DCE5F6
MRDQTILFLKMCPKTTGLAEEMLTWLDAKVRMLGKELEKIPTEWGLGGGEPRPVSLTTDIINDFLEI